MTDERGFKLLQVEILGQQVSLETRPGLFSPEHVDRGTLAMLSHVKIASGMRIMDLGCGCGVVGVVAAKIAGEENVFMSDADPMAVETASISSCPILRIRRIFRWQRVLLKRVLTD